MLQPRQSMYGFAQKPHMSQSRTVMVLGMTENNAFKIFRSPLTGIRWRNSFFSTGLGYNILTDYKNMHLTIRK